MTSSKLSLFNKQKALIVKWKYLPPRLPQPRGFTAVSILKSSQTFNVAGDFGKLSTVLASFLSCTSKVSIRSVDWFCALTNQRAPFVNVQNPFEWIFVGSEDESLPGEVQEVVPNRTSSEEIWTQKHLNQFSLASVTFLLNWTRFIQKQKHTKLKTWRFVVVFFNLCLNQWNRHEFYMSVNAALKIFVF